jgi:hypothetical protein
MALLANDIPYWIVWHIYFILMIIDDMLSAQLASQAHSYIVGTGLAPVLAPLQAPSFSLSIRPRAGLLILQTSL